LDKQTLHTLFRTYQSQLLQLDATRSSATRQDVIAIDDASLRDSLTTKAKKRVDVFALGTRANDVLFPSTTDYSDGRSYAASRNQQQSGQQVLPQPILASIALMEKKQYPYEVIFRSIIGHLVEAVTNEHIFCRQFFKRDAFGPLFSGTLSDLQEQLENYLFGCHDALALLLMIKVIHQYRRLTRQRTIHSLDNFFDQVNQLLWPRLKMVMDMHRRSVKSATAVKLGVTQDLLHGHYVSRRFAEFSCSVLLILKDGNAASSGGSLTSTPKRKSHKQHHQHKPGTDSKSNRHEGKNKTEPAPMRDMSGGSGAGGTKSAGDMLLQDLSGMLDEFVLLLERLAEEHTSSKRRVVFLINNLDQIVCIFQERRVVGKEFNRLVEKLMAQRELFVEEELLVGFSKMIAFVQQTEAHIASTKGSSYDVNPQVVQSLVREFSLNWKANIELINRNVLSYFSNFRNGMEILKQVLTQLLLYYTRFQDIIRKVWKNNPPAFCKDLVNTTLILAEIKKYALAI